MDLEDLTDRVEAEVVLVTMEAAEQVVTLLVGHLEARVAVEFENELAGRVFYEALSKRPARKEREEEVTDVSLPVVFSVEHRRVRGPNAGFNRAVRECDTNGDRKITEVEAKIWAGRTAE